MNQMRKLTSRSVTIRRTGQSRRRGIDAVCLVLAGGSGEQDFSDIGRPSYANQPIVESIPDRLFAKSK